MQFRNVLKWCRWALTESLVKVVRHPFDYIHIEWSQTTRKKIEVCQKNCTCCACTICLKSFNSFPNCSTSHLIWCKRFLKSQMKKLKIFRLESPFLGNRFSELKRLCVGTIPDWRPGLTNRQIETCRGWSRKKSTCNYDYVISKVPLGRGQGPLLGREQKCINA